jgi:hypothetical protein
MLQDMEPLRLRSCPSLNLPPGVFQEKKRHLFKKTSSQNMEPDAQTQGINVPGHGTIITVLLSFSESSNQNFQRNEAPLVQDVCNLHSKSLSLPL